MKSPYLKALKFFLAPSILVYVSLSFVMLSFTRPINWFLGTDTMSLLLRAILLCVELLFYVLLVRFYASNSNKNFNKY